MLYGFTELFELYIVHYYKCNKDIVLEASSLPANVVTTGQLLISGDSNSCK
jgi:hypothetical protein